MGTLAASTSTATDAGTSTLGSTSTLAASTSTATDAGTSNPGSTSTLAASTSTATDVSDVKLVPYAASMSSQYYHLNASRCINGITIGDFSNLCHTDVNSDRAPWLLLEFQNEVAV